jgi:hypothetical protein
MIPDRRPSLGRRETVRYVPAVALEPARDPLWDGLEPRSGEPSRAYIVVSVPTVA